MRSILIFILLSTIFGCKSIKLSSGAVYYDKMNFFFIKFDSVKHEFRISDKRGFSFCNKGIYKFHNEKEIYLYPFEDSIKYSTYKSSNLENDTLHFILRTKMCSPSGYDELIFKSNLNDGSYYPFSKINQFYAIPKIAIQDSIYLISWNRSRSFKTPRISYENSDTLILDYSYDEDCGDVVLKLRSNRIKVKNLKLVKDTQGCFTRIVTNGVDTCY